MNRLSLRHPLAVTAATILIAGSFGLPAGHAQSDDPESPPPEVQMETRETVPPGGEIADPEQLDEIEEILRADEEIMAGEGYSYDPGDRRDPFVSLLVTSDLERVASQRPPGVPGLLIDEIEVKGIFELHGRYFAQVETHERETSYLLQVGDQLYDGDVVDISPNEVVFKQIVEDPSVVKPFREVVKQLNPES